MIINSYYPIPPVTALIVSASVTGRYRPNNRSPVTESMFSMSSVNSRLPVNFFNSCYCVFDFSEWFFVKCVLEMQNERSR
jgi:hypothetical protein